MQNDAPNVFRTRQGRIIITLFFIVLAFLIGMQTYDRFKQPQPPETTVSAQVATVAAPTP